MTEFMYSTFSVMCSKYPIGILPTLRQHIAILLEYSHNEERQLLGYEVNEVLNC